VKSAGEIIQEKGFAQEQDSALISALVDKVLAENPKSVADYQGGKEAALKFLMGQVMRQSGGRVNPVVATEWIVHKLGKG
jgi:aspartyl-tRNA(Asn)/glutamyl-tRNA(Gln) amidotransferase subunit B